MKVLVISPFLPYPEKSGSRSRTLTLLRSLAGHDVFLIAFREEDEPVPGDILNHLCGQYYVFPKPSVSRWRVGLSYLSPKPLIIQRFEQREARRMVRRLVEKEGIECIIAEAILVGEYSRPFRDVYRVLNAHNIEFMRARGRARMTRQPFKKIYYSLIAERMRRYERRTFGDFDLGLVCSEVDRITYQKLAPGRRVVTIPNTVDTEVLSPAWSKGEVKKIVFTGTLWYEPNADAARWLAEDIFPPIRLDFPEMELLVVGDHPPEDIRALSSRPGVSIVGPVEDIRPYLTQPAVFASPVRMGSGTRQKILDAMAMELPVVSTAAGCEGLEVKDDEDICLAETPEEFREKVRRLVRDEEFRSRIARGGRRLVESKYSRRAAVERAAALWQEVATEIRKHG